MATNGIKEIKVSNTNYLIEPTLLGTCGTAANTAIKDVTLSNFELFSGVQIAVKFSITNTAAVSNLKLRVNSSNANDAKSIKYRGGNLPAASTLTANRVYNFVYDGTNWELVGDLDTNTQSNYGNITTAGKIGTTADLAVYTTTDGLVTAGSLITNDPTAATTTSTTFIDTISQDSKGKISATKKTLPTASTSTAGIIQIGTDATNAAAGNHSHTLKIGNKSSSVDTTTQTWDLDDILYNSTNTILQSTSWEIVNSGVYGVSNSSHDGTGHPGSNGNQNDPYGYGHLIVIRAGDYGAAQFYINHNASYSYNNNSQTLSGIRYRSGWNVIQNAEETHWRNWATILDDKNYFLYAWKRPSSIITNQALVSSGTDGTTALRAITNNTTAGTAITANTNLITANTVANWSGSSNISTLGTVTTGVWNASTIGASYIDTAIARTSSPALSGTPTAPTADDGTSTTQIATTEFVMNQFKYNDAMLYKGVVNANTDLPATHYQGWTYKVATAGTYAGIQCEVGDMIICNTDGTSANNAHWNVIQTNIDGAVISSSTSSTDNAIARFDSTTGKIIKNSKITIDDNGNLLISHATSTTMTAASTNPKITFAENGVQPVHLIYSDYDSYRAPAGLKIIGGTSVTPAWLEVEGNVYASSFVGNATSATIATSANALNGLGRLTASAEAVAFNTTTSVGNRMSWCIYDSTSRSKDATNSPTFDATTLNMPWDWGAYVTQLALQNAGTRLQIRGASNVDHGEGTSPRYTPTYTAWREIVTADKATQMGSSTQPVYISSTGQVTACTTYANASVQSAEKIGYVSATDNNYYPILMKNSVSSTTTAGTAKFNTEITINPYTKSITASEFIGQIRSDRIYRVSATNGMSNVVNQPLVSSHRANRLAFLPADQIIIEQTIDGGNTWTDAGISDAVKTQLFSEVRPAVRIPLINGEINTLCGIRITFTPMKYDVPDGTAETAKYNYWNSDYVIDRDRYSSINSLYFWVSSGANAIKVKLEAAPGNNSTTWSTLFEKDDYGMTGWSGSDFISFTSTVFGGSPTSQQGNKWNWRLTFMTCGPNGSSTLNQSSLTSQQNVSEIRGYGESGWVGNSMSMRDHLYTWDYLQNMSIPANLILSQNNQIKIGTATLTATNYSGTAATATTATTADKLTGFSGRASTMAWGNQTGSVVTCFSTSGGGGWGFRDNNPTSGQLSMTIDGTIYIKEGAVNISDAIKTISRSGDTFTYTTLWGNTGTFTQSDANVTHTLSTTTKYYVTGTTSTTTSTGGDTFDTGVYVTTTAGELSAVRHSWNASGTEKAYTTYNTTDDCIDFVFI